MQKKSALGKGLSALIPGPEAPEGAPEGIQYCPTDQIHANPDQPRKHFDQEALDALAETIKEKGILQPLLIRKIGSHYELIAGERRLRAAKMAGVEKVPVIIREVEESESLELSMLENIQREDLNPIEEATAYREMLQRLNITQEVLAQKMGKDRSSIANAIRLLQLPREIQEDITAGELSAGHARALLGLDHEIQQLKIRELIKKKGFSVRETEKYIQLYKSGAQEKKAGSSPLDPDMQRIQEELRRHFGAMVKIMKGKKGGKIQIQYASSEELNRIYSLLVR